MTTVEIEIKFGDDLDGLRRRLEDGSGVRRALGRLLDSTAEAAQSFAQIDAPKDTTRLASHIGRVEADLQPSGAIQARVGVAPVHQLPGGQIGPLREKQSDYPFFVHEGTGVFGALHRRIVPRRAKAMRFFGRTGLRYALSVAGQKPQPYIGDAFHEVQPFLEARIPEAIREILDGRL